MACQPSSKGQGWHFLQADAARTTCLSPPSGRELGQQSQSVESAMWGILLSSNAIYNFNLLQ